MATDSDATSFRLDIFNGNSGMPLAGVMLWKMDLPANSTATRTYKHFDRRLRLNARCNILKPRSNSGPRSLEHRRR